MRLNKNDLYQEQKCIKTKEQVLRFVYYEDDTSIPDVLV